MSDADHEQGYLSALRDLKVHHEFRMKELAGMDEARAHEETIEFLKGLIATKEKRIARTTETTPIAGIRSMEP